MDQNTLVDGGDAGLRQIAQAYREAGFPVQAIYLTKRRGLVDDEPRWTIVAVVSPFGKETDSDAITAHVRLRRSGKLPFIDPEVRLDLVPPTDGEASRILAHSRRFGSPPFVVRNLGVDGWLIDYALVAEDLGHRAQAA